jgi:hypothetical protein
MERAEVLKKLIKRSTDRAERLGRKKSLLAARRQEVERLEAEIAEDEEEQRRSEAEIDEVLNGRSPVLSVTPTRREISATLKKVVDFVEKGGRVVSPIDLVEGLGYKKDKARQDLWRAMDAGHLARHGRGLYGPLSSSKLPTTK